MSMYNKLFGYEAKMPAVISELFDIDLNGPPENIVKQGTSTIRRIARFRDAYINKNKELVLFTRTGGSNRAEYGTRPADAPATDEIIYNDDLEKLPGFVRSYDSALDSTYAYFIYVPHTKPLIDELAILDVSFVAAEDPDDKFANLYKELQEANASGVYENLSPAANKAFSLGRSLASAINTHEGEAPVAVLDEDKNIDTGPIKVVEI